MQPVKKHARLVILWLSLCAALVVGMVVVGGYTRLSGSGLSITEWKPIHGVIPPKDDAEWAEEFEKYRQIPQYSEINKGMSLEEFKQIFWPEYWHRVLGRIIGIVFAVPLFAFWITKSITSRFAGRLFLIFTLGGLQGLMGWYMVSSGLIHNVYVSHMRLAAHFALALLLFALILWAIMDVKHQPKTRTRNGGFRLWLGLLCLQIFYGALMAGLHAGLLYNTFPDMNGQYIPEGLWNGTLGWLSLFEERTMVNFIHRWLASFLVMGFGFWWFVNREHVKKLELTTLAAAMALVLALQFILGVLTLVKAVPLALALKHQLVAVLLFGLSVTMLHRLEKK